LCATEYFVIIASPYISLFSTHYMPSAVVTAYRSLYRTALHAVRYSRPARYVIRDRLRRAFRDSPATDFEPDRIANTILFLRAAATDTGLEHRVLKNLSLVWYWEAHQWSRRHTLKAKYHKNAPVESVAATVQGYDQFYELLRMLNQTMGLCLR
jgi:hypothetical protein